MDPKEFLKQYQRYKCIASMYRETALAAETELATLDTQVRYFELKEKTRKFAVQLKSIIRGCEKKTAAAEKICLEVKETINSVPDPTQRQVLEMRYIDGSTWDEIAGQLYYSAQYVHILHNKALTFV